jgi:hypothetical protein
VQEEARNPRKKAERAGNSKSQPASQQQETFFSPALRAAATPVPGALFFLRRLSFAVFPSLSS